MAIPVVSMGLAGAVPPQPPAPVGQDLVLNEGDLRFILDQIKIAEAHGAVNVNANGGETSANRSLTGTGRFQLSNPSLPHGLRTVDGSLNNLVPGQSHFGATDHPFIRLAGKDPRPADAPWTIAPLVTLGGPDNNGNPVAVTSYEQKLANNVVIDRAPRMISNLIVDQTPSNPAAVAASASPARAASPDATAWPCATLPDPLGAFGPIGDGNPATADCTPAGETLSIPNVTTDFGLSPGYNSFFTIFGQFFDHGVDLTAKGGGTVYVPLNADDPLIVGPDGVAGGGDDPVPGDPDYVAPSRRFMALTRAQNLAGTDGILGTADDITDTKNGDSSWVDQSQTYSSIPSHQVFLREYAASASGPLATGKLIEQPGVGGMGTWGSLKAQAATLLGIQLVDTDVGDVPMILTDPYGRFLRGDNGYPQIVAKNNVGTTILVEGNPAGGGVLLDVAGTYTAVRSGIAFLNDIAHHAAPGMSECHGAGGPDTLRTADADAGTIDDGNCRTYDDEMLNAHFVAGDGRVNENIALVATHQVFHSEHNRLVDYINNLVLNAIPASQRAAWQDTSTHWLTRIDYRNQNGCAQAVCVVQLPGYQAARDGVYQERLFQAARFVTEMQYQHLVFEEFGRKMAPAINPFAATDPGIDAAVTAEFAHAVYRFGHSMLTDTVSRTNSAGVAYDVSLFDAFLNPPMYRSPGGAGGVNIPPAQAAGDIIMGMTDQAGEELDEFVADTLRNNLLGLPLDLATLNLTRARDTAVPRLNAVRGALFAATADASLQPYVDWFDFGQQMKHPESLVNFVAAYGTHASITGATTMVAKRAAAQALVTANDPFIHEAAATSGVDDVDLWIGGLAEATNTGGGLLGSTFNYVFEQQMTKLQDGDRLYYLARTAGLNLLSQLEGNSFAELIQRNTTAVGLNGDVFALADCEFNMAFAGNPANQSGTNIADDPETACNENLLLTVSNGSVRYRTTNAVDPAGLNGQSTFNGTAGDDRMWGGVDTDTFWGGAGRDIIEGGDGFDIVKSGDDGDIISDSFGDDFIRSGNGDDAVDAGPGLDVVVAGSGKDYVNGGLNANTVFAGIGDDFIIAGTGDDAAEGNSGDDWIEGGAGNDIVAGDSLAPFFRDLDCVENDALPNAQCIGGHDVLIGGEGAEDVHSDGGDDIIVAGPGTEFNEGIGGFDWITWKGSAAAGDTDLTLGFNTPPANLLDRNVMVEGVSGWNLNDNLLGDSYTTLQQDFSKILPWGSNALTTAGIDRVSGLRALLAQHDRIGEDRTAATATTADDCYTDPQAFNGITPPSTVALTICGYVKGGLPTVPGVAPKGGNILLGGGGSDNIRGRGADDVIDGDRWLNVRIEHRPVGGPVTSHENLSTLTSALTSAPNAVGHVNPGDLYIVREVLTATGGTDIALYGNPYADYDIWTVGGVTRVSHVRNIPAGGGDGTDTLTGIESVRFTDRTILVSRLQNASVNPTSLAFGAQGVLTPSAGQSVMLTHTGGAEPLTISPATITGTDASSFAVTTTCGTSLASLGTCTYSVVFTPANIGAKSATLVITTNAGPRLVALSGTGGGTANVTATGAPTISDTTPTEGQALTVNPLTIVDGNGLPASFTYQWQQNNIGGAGTIYTNIAGATAATYTPVQTDVNKRLQVVVSFIDLGGFPESRTSVPTTVVGNLIAGTAAADSVVVSTSNANGGTAGQDDVRGGASNDSLSTGDESDVVWGDGGDDTIITGNGDDHIWFTGAANGFDNVTGGAGIDVIHAAANGTDIGLSALLTVEEITAGGFTPVRIVGSAAANTLNFTITTMTGISAIDGGAGADIITGSNTSGDVIIGGLGNDNLKGGGNSHVDILEGGADNDTLDGGAGNDFLRYPVGAFGADTVNGFDANATGGQDLIDLRGRGITAATFAANVTITSNGTNTTVTILGAGGGTIVFNLVSGAGTNVITIADFVLV